MPESNCKPLVFFPDSVFEAISPSQLVQSDWMGDKGFLNGLQASWKQQYAEYLGWTKAELLVDRLSADGAIHTHDSRYTLQAMVDNRCVGVCSLRPLSESGNLGLITLLEVACDYRHRGIGRQLVCALETVSENLLAHVSIHRPHVKRFYEGLGFHCLEQTTVDHYGHQLLFDVVARRCRAGLR